MSIAIEEIKNIMIYQVMKKWQHQGNAFLWRYLENQRNYPGWHFTCDNTSCSSMLTLFDIMENGADSLSYEIKISTPTKKVLSVPNNLDGNARYECAKIFTLQYCSQDSDLWTLENFNNVIKLKFGRKVLPVLRKGLHDILQGDGDYAIGLGSDNYIWLWWMLD